MLVNQATLSTTDTRKHCSDSSGGLAKSSSCCLGHAGKLTYRPNSPTAFSTAALTRSHFYSRFHEQSARSRRRRSRPSHASTASRIKTQLSNSAANRHHPPSYRVTSQTKSTGRVTPRQSHAPQPANSPTASTQHTSAITPYVHQPLRGGFNEVTARQRRRQPRQRRIQGQGQRGRQERGRSHGDLVVLERVPLLLLAEGGDADDAALAGQHGEPLREELVHLPRHLAALRDGPHDQRLAAPAVCNGDRNTAQSTRLDTTHSSNTARSRGPMEVGTGKGP